MLDLIIDHSVICLISFETFLQKIRKMGCSCNSTNGNNTICSCISGRRSRRACTITNRNNIKLDKISASVNSTLKVTGSLTFL